MLQSYLVSRTPLLLNTVRRPSEASMARFIEANKQQGITCRPGEPVPTHLVKVDEAAEIETTQELADAFNKETCFSLDHLPLRNGLDRSILRPNIQTYLHVKPDRRNKVSWSTIANPLVEGGCARYYEHGEFDSGIVKRAKKNNVSDDDHKALHELIFAAAERVTQRAYYEFYQLLDRLGK